jgi:predicted nucleotidyltransferase
MWYFFAKRVFPGEQARQNMSKSEILFPAEPIRALCEEYHVRELALFGSARTERFRPDSDIDLLVQFAPDAEVGFLELAALQRRLSAVLGRQVDLVPKDGLKPTIRDEVLASAEVVYAA